MVAFLSPCLLLSPSWHGGAIKCRTAGRSMCVAKRPRITPIYRIDMLASDEGPNVATRVGAAILVAAFAFSALIPLISALKISGGGSGGAIDATSLALSRVPVFAVTDSAGHPYLTEPDDDSAESLGNVKERTPPAARRGYFFLSPRDAERFLEIARKNSSDARVTPVGLDVAADALERRLSRQGIPEVFSLFPDEMQADAAKRMTNGDFERRYGQRAVPVFYVEGLAVKQEGGADEDLKYPLFFERETMEQYLKKVQQGDQKDVLDEKDIRVVDLLQTIREMRAGGNEKLNRVMFFPLESASQYMRDHPIGEEQKKTSIPEQVSNQR